MCLSVPSFEFAEYDGKFLTAKKAWDCFFSRLTTGYEQKRGALITWVKSPHWISNQSFLLREYSDYKK